MIQGRPRLAAAPRSLLAIISCISCCVHAFHAPGLTSVAAKAKAGVSASRTALSLLENDPSSSSSSSSSSSLPFFAAPAFASSSSQASSGGQASSPPQSATVTLRLPLGTLFDGRDYTFVTESNVRGYEWTAKETDILLDDLMDAALGNLGGMPDDGKSDITTAGAGAGASASASAGKPPHGIITDYELSQIVLVPTSDWDSNLLGLGNRYDVYDGQQRLVTLNLLLAGLRDSFRAEADELVRSNVNSNNGGKRAVALAATAIEISGMLMPTKVRKEDVVRIKLRKRDNVLLEKILVGDGGGESEDGSGGGGNGGSSDTDGGINPRDYTKLSPKGKTTLLSPLSLPNTRIFSNFVHSSKRLGLLTTRERLRLLDYIVERVYLLVCIPETSRIARNIVMSQGRKGMDNEPVDDFKGLVCFRYTLEEEDMYQTFDQWDALAAEPSPINNNINNNNNNSAGGAASSSSTAPSSTTGNIKSVGRDIVTSACLLRASAALRTKIRSRGGDEVYEWERWIRQELWLQNQRLSSDDSTTEESKVQQAWQGKDFFAKEIEPASIALYKFRTGQWDEFSFLSKASNKKMTKKERDSVVAKLTFLRDITMGVTSAKEAEVAVLELLLRAEDGEESSRLLDDILPLIEKWTLWMALARPSPMQRHARVCSLLDAMDDVDSVGSSGLAAASGEEDLATMARVSMNEYEFGASAGGKRLAAAILKRMNTHLMLEEKKTVPDGTTSVDLIQQHWPNDEESEEWANRIGNLALVSSGQPRSRRAKKSSDNVWESKCMGYKKEPWLLTRQLSELDSWDLDAVKDQQKELLSLMDLVWNLRQ